MTRRKLKEDRRPCRDERHRRAGDDALADARGSLATPGQPFTPEFARLRSIGVCAAI
jgi:hypothetical protein